MADLNLSVHLYPDGSSLVFNDRREGSTLVMHSDDITEVYDYLAGGSGEPVVLLVRL